MKMNKVMMLGAGLLLMGACSAADEAVDDTALEPSLETRIDRIASTACDRFEECGDIGSGKDYENREACMDDMRQDFRDLWPADECSDGRVNAEAYDICDKKAETYSCDMGLFEFISYYQSCSASDVCTDPRQ